MVPEAGSGSAVTEFEKSTTNDPRGACEDRSLRRPRPPLAREGMCESFSSRFPVPASWQTLLHR